MATRILIPLAVFGIGFGLGYGLTFVLVDEPAVADAAPAAEQGPEAETPTAQLGASAAPGVEPPPEVTVAGDAERVAGTPDPAPAAEEVPAAPQEPGSAEAPEVAESWWDACRGRRCTVDFGGVTGGLSVRRGTVEHGGTIDWDKTFAGAKRIDVLPTDARTVVQVVSVGLDAAGLPAAAQIEWRSGGEQRAGVIALNVGDKRVTMAPADR